ncbi:hypothetical protein ACFPRL_01860 [Pseudoclavibacter helvolus]
MHAFRLSSSSTLEVRPWRCLGARRGRGASLHHARRALDTQRLSGSRSPRGRRSCPASSLRGLH